VTTARSDLDSKISEKDKEIEKFEGMVSNWEKQLENEKKQISDRLDIGKQCRSYREEVARIFRDAKSSLQSESDEEKKPYAKTIIEKITAEEEGHKKAIDKVTEGITKCERMR
jgi:hypothetical protein